MNGQAKKKILILLDKKKVLEHGINLGDTSLSVGLYDVIHRQLPCDLISGGWKNFPFLSYRRLKRDYQKNKSIDQVLKIWVDEIESLAKNKDAKFLKYLLLDSALVNSRLVKDWELRNQKKFNFSYLDKIRTYVLKSYTAKKFLSKIIASDLVIFSGGGNIRDHNKPHVPGYLFEMYMAKMLGKKVIASNYTLYLNDPLLKEFAGEILKTVDLNLVREPISKQILLEMGISKEKISLMPDSAFGVNLTDKKYNINKNKIDDKYAGSVGINLRGDKSINVEFWKEVARYIDEKYKLTLCFFYTCKACDEVVYQKLHANFNLLEVKESLSFIETLALIKKMKFVITDRYHAAVFSIMAGTPFLPVNAKTHKIEGLLKLIDYPINEIDKENEENLNTTTDSIDYLLANHKNISLDLHEKSEKLYNQVNNVFKDVFDTYL